MSNINLGDILFMGAMGIASNISMAKDKLTMKKDYKKFEKEMDNLSADLEKYRKIAPIIVSDTENLDKAVASREKIIIVNNKDLFPSIKENVDKDTTFYNHRLFKNVLTGGIAIAALIPALTIPASVALTISVSETLTKKMRQYSWVESEEKGFLILIKTKGENCFNDKFETIDYENAREYGE